MRYALEQGPTEKTIIEQSIKYKMPLPDSILNAPNLFSGNELYFNAFRHLSTCRVNGMGLGSITYFMCTKYCVENDIVGEQRDDFIEILLAMDEFYLEWHHKRTEKNTKKLTKDEPEGE